MKNGKMGRNVITGETEVIARFNPYYESIEISQSNGSGLLFAMDELVDNFLEDLAELDFEVIFEEDKHDEESAQEIRDERIMRLYAQFLEADEFLEKILAYNRNRHGLPNK